MFYSCVFFAKLHILCGRARARPPARRTNTSSCNRCISEWAGARRTTTHTNGQDTSQFIVPFFLAFSLVGRTVVRPFAFTFRVALVQIWSLYTIKFIVHGAKAEEQVRKKRYQTINDDEHWTLCRTQKHGKKDILHIVVVGGPLPCMKGKWHLLCGFRSYRQFYWKWYIVSFSHL